jgi:hypothetical protein
MLCCRPSDSALSVGSTSHFFAWVGATSVVALQGLKQLQSLLCKNWNNTCHSFARTGAAALLPIRIYGHGSVLGSQQTHFLRMALFPLALSLFYLALFPWHVAPSNPATMKPRSQANRQPGKPAMEQSSNRATKHLSNPATQPPSHPESLKVVIECLEVVAEFLEVVAESLEIGAESLEVVAESLEVVAESV